ncbi:hypothetical protein BG015_007180 [Linnemannia schmuckeri]|uniref:Uncharacterized protein n=1 Tax=Linnemannia schmuckeri TaxID=64567 RepID=A0A9P5RYW0_9FUNG|nr:hypothetical protein BG015_007180 [Linnemannia schmuckeri]
MQELDSTSRKRKPKDLERLDGLEAFVRAHNSAIREGMGQLNGLDSVVRDLDSMLLKVKADQQLLKDEVEVQN